MITFKNYTLVRLKICGRFTWFSPKLKDSDNRKWTELVEVCHSGTTFLHL